MRDNTNKGCLIMLSHLHISQLDILGFTEVYRLLFILAISLIIIAFIMFPLVRLFIKWNYISFMVFIFTTCLLWIIILLYDKYTNLSLTKSIWIKTTAVYIQILFVRERLVYLSYTKMINILISLSQKVFGSKPLRFIAL